MIRVDGTDDFVMISFFLIKTSLKSMITINTNLLSYSI